MAKPGVRFTNLPEFQGELKAFTVEIPKLTLALQKKIALDLLAKIVLRNPVGNPDLWQNPDSAPPGYVGGRSRANWQVSVSQSEPGNEPLDTTDQSGTVSRGIAAMAAAQPFSTIWIYNNVPYIVRLEYGWSSQAPQGMVRLSLAEVEASIR